MTTDERKLVLEVEQNLIDLAAGIASLIDVAEKEAPAGDPAVAEFKRLHRETVGYIANKPWFDLVCTQDFFNPTHDLHLGRANLDDAHTQAFRKRNIQLPLGDYVTRLLLNRVEYWVSVLEPFSYRCTSLVPTGLGTSKRFKAMDRLFSRRVKLDQSVEKLISVCNEPKKQGQREAAATLTLVLAAYSANPQLQWLGGAESGWKVHGRAIRNRIRRRGTVQSLISDANRSVVLTPPVEESLCDPSVIRQIASSLQEMVAFFGVIDNPREIIAAAADRATLVMVDREPREVCFNGEPTGDVIWDDHAMSWNLLWKLAGKTGTAVEREALAKCTEKAFRSRRNRLGTLLGEASQLNALIDSESGLGYKLNLVPDEVILLQDDGFGNLRELSETGAR